MGKILEQTARALEMPQEVVTDCPELTISGNRELRLEGYSGLLEYTDTQIRVSAGRQVITVNVNNLEIKSIATGQITVIGRFFSVDFQ